MKNWLSQKVQSRQGGTWLLALTYVCLCSVLRVGLLIVSAGLVSWGPATFLTLFVGLLFDAAMAWFFVLPFGLISALSSGKHARYWLIPLWFFGVFLFTFWKISEILFWEEFAVRFNFIAVDYLIYTSEVIKNIQESYNLTVIFGAVSLMVLGFFLLWRRLGFVKLWLTGLEQDVTRRFRKRFYSPLFVLLTFTYFVGRHDLKVSSHVDTGVAERLVAGFRHMGDVQPSFGNSYDAEIAKKGEYAFLAAFWANQLEWSRFYPSQPDAIGKLRERLKGKGVELLKDGEITRKIDPSGSVKKWNVIQITIESLSAEFLGCYGEPGYAAKNLTPNLDRISKESIWFRHCYAGGTRTVRGMEALALSIPPIPGQSVLRRKGCENLTTLGSVLNTRGYDTAFIYGGDGFFDNMNYFFSTNGYRVVDLPRQLALGKETTFANAWGACDEDAFNWSLDEADKAYAAGMPFHHFVMTTSNHRPYTWPAGKINPALSGRDGGVAYTDYAIGEFLKAAAKKPWFNDTVFVIVADHCASVAGKSELEIRKYEIPLFIWSPDNFKARQVDKMMSQIDTAPTLLGLLRVPYVSRFIGADVLRPDYKPRAFISNYQKVAVLHDDGLLTVLKPVRQVVQYQADLATGALTPVAQPQAAAIEEALYYYQGADELFNHGGLINPAK